MKYLCTSFCLAYLFLISCDNKGAEVKTDDKPNKAFICRGADYVGKLKVAVVIYNGIEVVDMSGPIDVFTKTNRIHDRYYVYTVAATDSIVYTEKCTLSLIPQYSIRDCPQPDIVVLPGCPPDVEEALLADTTFANTVLAWIKKLGGDSSIEVMSVCTGGVLLGKTGLLDGRTATTHYLALEQMQQLYPKIHVVGGVRFVDDKNTISTAGITSGIDGALHLIEKNEGKVVADSVAHIMVYNRDCPMRGN